MKRIFIAIKVEPSERLLSLVSTLRSALKDEPIKWTSMGNIHITLAFLGDTDEDKISGIEDMLKEKCGGTGTFELVLSGTGVFRNPEDPRIIWTGIGPSANLTHLNIDVMNGLKEMGIKMEDRPYNPHLTIGRIKHLKDRDLLKSLIERFHNSEIQIVPVNEVILYESILKQTGPVYTPLYRINLLK
jgi:RNA 2',3'-cyclic 3'-phosphodiesterase